MVRKLASMVLVTGMSARLIACGDSGRKQSNQNAETGVGADGTNDYSRRAELTTNGENPKLYQSGLQLLAGKDYFMRLDISGDEDIPVQITITGEDGTVYLDEICDYMAGDEERFEYKFSMTKNVDDENAVITIALPITWLTNVGSIF